MGKSFFGLIGLLIAMGIPGLAGGWEIDRPLPWGLDVQAAKRLETGLVRTYYGLSAAERSYTERYCKDFKVGPADVRVYFSFLPNGLRRVEAVFKRPNQSDINRTYQKLFTRFGAPTEGVSPKLPPGAPFADRQSGDLVWETDTTRINMRFYQNEMGNGITVLSLFVTFIPK